MLTIAISLLSLAVALIALYYNTLRPPRVAIIVNDTLGILCWSDGFGLQLPITFVNTSPTSGIVTRCSAVLHKEGHRNLTRHILWYDFRVWNADLKKWVMEDLAGALVVAGKSSITKNVYFYWNADGEMPFEVANYVVTFCAWLNDEELPSLKSVHKFALSPKLLAALQTYKSENKKEIEEATLIDSYQRNEMMTESRLQKLLGL